MCISEGYITGYLLIVHNTTLSFVKLWIRSAFTKYAMAGVYVGNRLSCFSKQRRLSEKKRHNKILAVCKSETFASSRYFFLIL